MKKQNTSFSKMSWPFKALGRRTKKMAVGIVDFFKNEELNELSSSLNKVSSQIAESIDSMKKSTEKYRENCKMITAYTHKHKEAVQNFIGISNDIVCKNKELQIIDMEARYSSYLRNTIWQNCQN